MAEPSTPPALRRGADGLDLLARVVAGAGLVALVVLIVVQVLFRYLLDQSLAWTEETSRFVFFLTSLVAITVAYRRSRHAGFTALVARLPATARRGVVLVTDLLGLAFFVVIGLSSIALIEVGLVSSAPATGIPLFWIYLTFPLVAAIGAVFAVEKFVEHWYADPATLLAGPEQEVLEEASEANDAIAPTAPTEPTARLDDAMSRGEGRR